MAPWLRTLSCPFHLYEVTKKCSLLKDGEGSKACALHILPQNNTSSYTNSRGKSGRVFTRGTSASSFYRRRPVRTLKINSTQDKNNSEVVHFVLDTY